jgi:hypothetical protein
MEQATKQAVAPDGRNWPNDIDDIGLALYLIQLQGQP